MGEHPLRRSIIFRTNHKHDANHWTPNLPMRFPLWPNSDTIRLHSWFMLRLHLNRLVQIPNSHIWFMSYCNQREPKNSNWMNSHWSSQGANVWANIGTISSVTSILHATRIRTKPNPIVAQLDSITIPYARPRVSIATSSWHFLKGSVAFNDGQKQQQNSFVFHSLTNYYYLVGCEWHVN